MLAFISFWRAAAVVLNDMGSSAFYAGAIAEHFVGNTAPWFVLAIMLLAYAVRSVYIESCSMFVRGGVYRVVKEAMGSTLAKFSVSALMFDYVLTGPISGVSAGLYLTGLIKDDVCDVVCGNRIRTRREALRGGMPPYKYVANRGLTFIENLLMGQNLGEWHSGLRAYSRKVLETVPWQRNSDDFVFDCQFLVQAAAFGFRLGDIPVAARYFEEASSINFRRSVRYGLASLGCISQFYLHRIGVRRSSLFERV